MHDHRHAQHTAHAPPGSGSGVLDPVCGMTVPADGTLRTAHRGTTYVFCSEHCLGKFRADPDRYAAPPGPEVA